MNSAKKNNQPIQKISAARLIGQPEEDEHAASAPDVIARFQRYQGVLVDTGVAIPRLLSEQRSLRAQVGRVEVERGDASELQQLRERLDTVGNALASAASQRASASESLLSLGDELRQTRRAAEAAMAGISQSVISDFQMRWARAMAELPALHSEAAQFGRILGRDVKAQAPYVATVGVADGGKLQVAYAGQIEDVPLPQEVAAITAHLRPA
jgi:hypothetical protein